MSLLPVSPQAVQGLLEKGALLIDIRSSDEHARERIAAARHLPVEQLAQESLLADSGQIVIFHCRSGVRTRMNAEKLKASTRGEAYVLEGGIDAWKRAGFEVIRDSSQPLELQRQVQIAAGSMILLGFLLGHLVSPWWHLLSGFVGAGLVFAGVSGFCGLARLLMKMPWNKPAAQAH